MWDDDEEDETASEDEKVLEEGGLDEEEAEVLEGKAAAKSKKPEDEIDPAALSVSAKEAIRLKLQADMEAFLNKGGAVHQVAADESKWEIETARAPDEEEDDK